MEMSSFAKLEERINKAVAHIEKLTEAKLLLEEENKKLRVQVTELEEELKRQQAAVARLEGQSSEVSERIKEKIEGLLNKINSYEQRLP
jgi:chromosome segregation ATPase